MALRVTGQPIRLQGFSTSDMDRMRHLLTKLKMTGLGCFEKREFRRAFQDLTAERRYEHLEIFFHELMEDQGIDDPVKACARLAEALPLDLLEAALKTKDPSFESGMQAAQALAEEARDYLERLEQLDESKLSPPLLACIKSALHSALIAIDNFLSAFGISDFFEPARGESQAHLKAQKLLLLVTVLTSLTAAVIAIFGLSITTGAIIAGTIALLFILNFIYQKFLKPTPSTLPKAENWTRQIEEKAFEHHPVDKRYLDQIAQCLINGNHPRTSPLLVGPTGVGKTEIARAFAHAVSHGAYPELKGKNVFYLNTANLVASVTEGSWGSEEKHILSIISRAMGRHRDQIILILDDLGMGCKKKEGFSLFGELLKSYLDDHNHGFPYVLGLITSEDYERNFVGKKGDAKETGMPALARRFHPIHVQNMSEEGVARALKEKIATTALSIQVEEGMPEYLYQQAIKHCPKDAPQPYWALKVLAKCIELARRPPERADLKSEGAALEKLRKDLGHARGEMFRTLARTQRIARDKLGGKGAKELTTLLLLRYFLQPRLSYALRQKDIKLNTTSAITRALVDRALCELKQDNFCSIS